MRYEYLRLCQKMVALSHFMERFPACVSGTAFRDEGKILVTLHGLYGDDDEPPQISLHRDSIDGAELIELLGSRGWIRRAEKIERVICGVKVWIGVDSPGDPILALLQTDRPKSVSEFFSRS